jgi:hypothetical protein
MTTTNVHAIEISIDNDILTVQGYQIAVEGNDFVRTDKRSGRPLQIAMKSKQNRDSVAYILDSDEWDSIRTYWDGFFEREFSTYLTVGEVPDRVAKWVERLPEYKITIGGKYA